MKSFTLGAAISHKRSVLHLKHLRRSIDEKPAACINGCLVTATRMFQRAQKVVQCCCWSILLLVVPAVLIPLYLHLLESFHQNIDTTAVTPFDSDPATSPRKGQSFVPSTSKTYILEIPLSIKMPGLCCYTYVSMDRMECGVVAGPYSYCYWS